MNEYFEAKKRQGFIFTLRCLSSELPQICINPETKNLITPPHAFWSRLSGRYRTAEEQKAYIASGGVDAKLPPLGGRA